MASIFSTGIGALNAFQRQLATTGHNIANVNTEGYSRQRVDLTTMPPERGPDGYLGNGVKVATIRRHYDDFLAGKVRDYNTSHQEYSVFHERAQQIDNVMGDAAGGIDETLQQFFGSIHDLSTDPRSIPVRTVMLNRADMLTERFQSLNGWMENQRSGLNADFDVYVSEINSIAESLVGINRQIQSALNRDINPPNDLLDSRDRLVDRLSEYVGVDTLVQEDGAMNVFIGSGQALVVGGTANTLSVTANTAALDQKELSLSVSGGSVLVTNQITGGKLGGLLRFREEVLDPAQNALGVVAVGLAHNFNQQHQAGVDLDGNAGGAFFSMPAPQGLASSGNAGAATMSVAFDSATIGNLTGHDYRVAFDGANWSVTNQNNGAASVLGPAGVYVHDGVEITIGGGAAASGDSFLLRPTRSAAANFTTQITDPREVAAAQSAAVGDNSNALALSDLQNASLLFGGAATLGDANGFILADVGTKTHQAGANAEVQKQLLAQAENDKSAISGVNLDEEAADLVKFQQAYSAAAQVIATANTLFDTLLGAVRG